MPNAAGIRAGKAYVSVSADTGPLQKGLQQARLRVEAWGKSIQVVGAKLQNVGSAVSGVGSSLATIGAVATAPFAAAIKAAGDMAETTSKLEAVFKEDSAGVKDWGNTYAKQVGRSKAQIQGFAADTGAILSGFGFGTKQAAELSKTVTQLAVDLGSFSNLKDADALQSLISGLSGQTEPLLKFGVAMSATAINAELLKKGIDPETATAAQKSYARLEFILARTKDAQGDATRTAGSFNNQMKALRGTVEDVAVEVGTALLPAATLITTSLRSTVATISKFVTENTGLVNGLAALSAAALGGGLALVATGKTIGIIGAGVGVLGTAITALVSPIGLLTLGLGGGIAAFLKWTSAGQQATSFVSAGFNSLLTTGSAAIKGIGAALAQGNLGLAANVAMSAIKLEFTKGLAVISQIWNEQFAGLREAYFSLGVGIAKVAATASFEIEKSFARAMSAISGSWGSLISSMIKLLAPLGSQILDALGVDFESLTNNALSGIGINPGQTQADRKAALDARLQEIDQAAAQQQANLDQGAFDSAQSRDADRRKAVQDALQAVEQAKAEFAAVTTDVAQNSPSEAVKKATGVTLPELASNVDQGLARTVGRTESKGAFSAAAIRGLNQGDTVTSAVEKVHDVARKQLTETEKMRRTLENSGRLQ